MTEQDRKKKKKKQATLEAQILRLMEKSMEAMLKKALDDIIKELK